MLLTYQSFLRRNRLKRKKGGVNIIIEFVLLLPFFAILCLMLFDIFKYYYLYNVTSVASYSAAYNFSMTANIKSAMDSAEDAFRLGGIKGDNFRSDNVQAWIYQYNKENQTFYTPISNNDMIGNINKTKDGLISGGVIPGLTDTYDNDKMRNREVWGFKFKIKNNLLSTIPASQFTNAAGIKIKQMQVDIIVRNHVFEMQHYEQQP